MDVKLALKRMLRSVGIDVMRLKNLPRETLLGLSERRFDSVIDVGANDGGFARWIAPFVPQAQLHCFEPLPRPAEALRAWGRRTNRALTVHEIALSDFEGETEIYEHVNHSASSSLLRSTAESAALFPITMLSAKRVIKVTTLDAWAARQSTDLGRMLLKLDVQGLEDRVLRGGANTLSAVDVVLVEVSIAHLYEGQATFVTLVELLHAAGLEYYGNLEQIYDERGAPIFIDSVFVRQMA
jgi:FkbM family methyltransferase